MAVILWSIRAGRQGWRGRHAHGGCRGPSATLVTVEPMGREPGATVPDPALVVLVGPSGSGKSAWAVERYRPREVVSSDQLRGVVGSGEHDLDASADAFALLDHIVAARLRRGRSARLLVRAPRHL